MTQPTVSVVIPACNMGDQLPRAVDSVLAQTHPIHEIFVVDDGSADNTAEVAARYGSSVKVIRKSNGGPGSARNLGASNATGEWLAFLDADDWWFPQKTEVQLEFTHGADLGLVHCLLDNRVIRPPPELTFDNLWEQNSIANSSVMIRRSLFHQLGGFNEHPSLISVEDYNLWLRVAASGSRIVTCPHILVHYTQGTGISSNVERLMRATLFNLDDLEIRLHLPAETVRRKRVELHARFGEEALTGRKIDIAREMLRKAVRDQPTLINIVRLIAANTPVPILDSRRTLRKWTSRPFLATPKLDGPVPGSGSQRVPVDEKPFWNDRRSASILDRAFHTPASTRELPKPLLVTTIDAEEDFDWNSPFDSKSSKVASMRAQHRAHRVFERHNVVPVYMVDYPVASQDEGRAPLLELLRGNHCDIGTQLHPWVTPPFVETVSHYNSYAGNLPQAVEYSKLARLTDELERRFGQRPRIYRAGRCGVGPNTGEILKHLGYQVDTSVMPHWNYGPQFGPDYRAFSVGPYWFDTDRSMLEIPITTSRVGLAADLPVPNAIDPFGGLTERLGVTAVLARLKLMERIRLTPEGVRIDEAKRLVRHMKAAGHHVFVLTYHSPSLEPGNTPYVRTQEDLSAFLRWLEEFYEFFTGEIGGACVGWRDVRSALLPS